MNLFSRPKTPVISLYGGLGNPLFQYAFGRAIEEKFKNDVKFDIYGFKFDNFYERKLELDYFKIKKFGYVTKPLIFKLARYARFMQNRFSYTEFLTKSHIITDKNIDFDNLNIVKPVYFFGYWQDERYFYNLQKALKNEIVLRNGLSIKNQKLVEEISSKNSIAIHCRRLHEMSANSNSSKGSDKSTTLNMDYYVKAISYIQDRINDPFFIVFSDLPEWASKNFNFIKNVKFLESNRGPDYEDLVLMSLCRHKIIANSSFSWWSAWLGEEVNQIIIAPSQVKHTPIIPDRWIKM